MSVLLVTMLILTLLSLRKMTGLGLKATSRISRFCFSEPENHGLRGDLCDSEASLVRLMGKNTLCQVLLQSWSRVQAMYLEPGWRIELEA